MASINTSHKTLVFKQTPWLCTIYIMIYMGKPVGPRYGQMVRKIHDRGEFRPGITAFTTCTNQIHLPENDREGLKPVLKLILKKWNTNFRLEYSARKNRTTFSDVSLLPQIFRWNDPKSRFPFTFQPDFPDNFGEW